MRIKYSIEQAVKLFEHALRYPRMESAELALKVGEASDLGVPELMFRAMKNVRPDVDRAGATLLEMARFNRLSVVLDLLQYKDQAVSTGVIEALRRLNDPRAMDALERLMRDSNEPELQKRALRAVSSIRSSKLKPPPFRPLFALDEHDEFAARAIIGVFSADDIANLLRVFPRLPKGVRKDAVTTLSAKHPDMREAVFRALDLTHLSIEYVTPELLDLLGRLCDSRGVDHIIHWLDDSAQVSMEVVAAGTQALAEIGDDRAISYLVKRLDVSPYSYELAALQKIGPPAIRFILRTYADNDRFRRSGAEHLAGIAGSEAISCLVNALRDRFREVRENAELGLIKLGKQAVQPLIALLEDNDPVARLHACHVLAEIGDDNALNLLEKMCYSKELSTQWMALEALGQADSPSSIKVLSHCLQSPIAETRRRATRELGRTDGSKAMPLLAATVRDADHRVRAQAILAIAAVAEWENPVPPEATTLLISALEDTDPGIAASARKELDYLGMNNASVLQGILQALKAVSSLETSRTKQTLEAIVSSIQEREIRRVEELDAPRGACYSTVADASPDVADAFDWRSSLYSRRRPPIASALRDAVNFSVTAPRVIVPRCSFVLDVWAHFGSLREEVAQRARDAQGGRDISFRSKGPVLVERGATLHVQLSIPDFGIEKLEDTIHWNGDVGNCTFPVTTPGDASRSSHIGTVSFFISGLHIAKLNFGLEVGAHEEDVAELTSSEERIKTAFASYAHDDRNKVLGRIQGMLKFVPDLDVFLDVASLRSGENWERRLEDEISLREVFYLFWSRAASQSTWVEKEWRIALAKKGIEFIDPIPLEAPDLTPPPAELASLHFNDWTLAFEN